MLTLSQNKYTNKDIKLCSLMITHPMNKFVNFITDAFSSRRKANCEHSFIEKYLPWPN